MFTQPQQEAITELYKLGIKAAKISRITKLPYQKVKAFIHGLEIEGIHRYPFLDTIPQHSRNIIIKAVA